VFGFAGGGLFASSLVSGAALFCVGSARSIITKKRWWIAGLEMLAVGGVAASAAYGVGAVIERLI
jgi:VIT1/CCC1 family predicted Fe2+/Mn2+ transporter